MLISEFIAMQQHCSHEMNTMEWAPVTQSMQASKQDKMGAVDAQRDQRKSGLKRQKANTILQMELQLTQVQLIPLS